MIDKTQIVFAQQSKSFCVKNVIAIGINRDDIEIKNPAFELQLSNDFSCSCNKSLDLTTKNSKFLMLSSDSVIFSTMFEIDYS